MKIGDLVELSAKGKGLKYCKEFIGLVGIVSDIDFSEKWSRKEWFYIDWCGGKKHAPHLRTDLKFVSKRK
tara:strand:- start:130 stop:339 length:210 start_codon:yes stop_codon:yes gene_type:complete